MKRADYEASAQAFRDMLVNEAAKPEHERQFPEDEAAWVRVPAVAICHTLTPRKCPSYDKKFKVNVGENADGVYRIVCGNCQKPISDLTAVFEDARVPLPTGGVK